jgi:hypothetical protein
LIRVFLLFSNSILWFQNLALNSRKSETPFLRRKQIYNGCHIHLSTIVNVIVGSAIQQIHYYCGDTCSYTEYLTLLISSTMTIIKTPFLGGAPMKWTPLP